MNKEIDKLICKVDGKLTYYRIIHTDNKELEEIQKIIQDIYFINNKKGILKK